MKKILRNLFFGAIISFFALSNHSFAQNLSTGGVHTLFRCADNSVLAWGWNNHGQLGDGTTNSTMADPPVIVNSMTDVIAIAGGGYHSLFLKSDGTVWGCGMNLGGELGDGTNTIRTNPVQISTLSNIVAISGGSNHSIFLKSDGTVWACGAGELGNGSTATIITPIQISSLSGIIAISGGHNHSLFLKDDGTVWACGQNSVGQLGDGTTTMQQLPVQVASLTDVVSIYAGFEHSMFVKNDGTVWACGKNHKGQLGDGTNEDKSTPIQVSGLNDVTFITGGQYFSLFLKNDNTAWATGENFGYFGDGTFTNHTIPILIGTGVSEIAAGFNFSMLLKTDGTLWASGVNNYGQLGDGNVYTYTTNPVQTMGLCEITNSVNEITNIDLNVYPNPSQSGIFTIELSNTDSEYEFIVTDVMGKTIFSNKSQTSKTELNLSNLVSGNYFIQVKSDSEIIMKQLVINH